MKHKTLLECIQALKKLVEEYQDCELDADFDKEISLIICRAYTIGRADSDKAI